MMHIEFAGEVQHRLETGQLHLTPAQRGMLWRSQARVWMEMISYVPTEIEPLIYEGVDLIMQAAWLAEQEREQGDTFRSIALRLDLISDQIMEWSV